MLCHFLIDLIHPDACAAKSGAEVSYMLGHVLQSLDSCSYSVSAQKWPKRGVNYRAP